MNEPRIGDIPSIQDTLKQAQGLVTLKRILPIVAPLLNPLGVDTDKITTELEMADKLAHQIQELSILPDQFNDRFGERGWIIYESMNLETAKKAVAIADAGNIDAAEQVLVDYFSPKTVGLWLNQMKAIKAFQPRMRLAQLALKDYEEDRYHACIPVVLALIDGLVNELNKGRGFFADTTDLEAWDSIVAHKQGLVQLGKIFRTGRKKTRIEEITIPYRNGILHGNDLGYDNKTVAAKTWAALFAVREWAIKAEHNTLEAPQQQPKPTILEALRQFQKTEEERQKVQQWKPRTIIDLEHSDSEEPEDYNADSPERKLIEFLAFWKAKNYGHMATCVPVQWNRTPGQMPKHIRDVLGEVDLISFRIIKINDTAPAVTEILAKLDYKFNQARKEKEHRFRVLYLNDDGKAEVRSAEGHSWYIRNWDSFNPY